MSRTLRLRHLPKLTAKKYVDASVRARFKEADERRRLQAKEIVGHCRKRYCWMCWHAVWHTEKLLERLSPAPVATTTDHPWICWGTVNNPAKHDCKRAGNRRVRRYNRALLRLQCGDWEYQLPDRCRFYGRQDGWSRWDLW